jgi:hypothetical protein
MLKVLVQAILNDGDESGMGHRPHGIDKAELQALFRDDFADHAMILRSRKAARRGEARLAA